MRKFTYLIFFLFLLTALTYFAANRPIAVQAIVSAKGRPASGGKEDIYKDILSKYTRPPERIGEKIVYNIRLGKVYLGKAIFNHLAKVELGGKLVSRMTFETRLARFTDLEIIYSDSNSFLPLKVERDISTWPISEKIIEHYDQKNFTLTVIKKKGRKKEELVIRKDGPIHNAIMLPFYIRRLPAGQAGMANLDVGWSMLANLPNQRFEIKLTALEELKVPAGTFKAYRFESVPRRFEIWLSADERKIPLKIKGSGAFGYTFVMKEYSL